MTSLKILSKTVGENLGAAFFGRLISQSLSFFLVVYLARILGPVAYGDLSLALATVSYFTLLANCGLPTIAIREIASSQDNPQEAASLIFSLRLLLAAISYFCLFVYGYFFISNSQLLYLILLYGLSMLSSSCFLDWFFMGMEDLRSLATANVLNNSFSCLVIFLLVKNVADIYYIPVIYFFGSVIASLYLLYIYRKTKFLRISVDFSKFLCLLRVAMPFAITGLFEQIYGNMDMILLGYMVGSKEVGYYSVAYKIILVLGGLVAIFSQSTFPVMIRLYGTNERLAKEFLMYSIHSMLYFMVPIVTGGTILAHGIIELFFGGAYAPAALPFIWVLVYCLFMSISTTLAHYILSVKADKVYLRTLIWGAVINVVANLVLIPVWHSTGSALAMVVAELFILFRFVSKVKTLHREAWLNKKFLAILIGSNAIMALCIYWMQVLTWNVGFIILMGALIYIGLSWAYCVNYIKRILAL